MSSKKAAKKQLFLGFLRIYTYYYLDFRMFQNLKKIKFLVS